MDKITNIILENEGLIYKIINKYKNYFELDDLYQVAAIGLIKAYYNYKEIYNTKFTSYAYPYILGEVIKYINESRLIKISKDNRILYTKILKAKEVLSQKLMREPSIYEISLFLEIDETIISNIININMTIESLDRIISIDDQNFAMYDKLGYTDQYIENYDLNNAISNLNEKERKIIIARYYHNMSQKEVGKSLGMYQVEVSREENKILKKLKNNIAT